MRPNLSVLALLVLLAAPSQAAKPQDDLKKIEDTLSAEKEREATLRQQAEHAQKDLEGLRQNLVGLAKEERARQEELQNLRTTASVVASQMKSEEQGLSENREKLAGLFLVLTRMSRLPPEVLLTQNKGDALAAIRGGKVLAGVTPALTAEANRLNNRLEQLTRLKAQLADQNAKIESTKKDLTERRSQIDGLMKQRAGLLQESSAARAEAMAKVETLSRQAEDLRDLVAKVTAIQTPLPPRTALGGNSRLLMPVSGPILSRYGQKDELGVEQNGMKIGVEAGTLIVAPAAGKIMFAGPFRGYGQILIVQHAGGYHTLLAGFGKIDVTVGQTVSAGEPLGSAGATRRDAHIYFEYRHNGQPIDPQDITQDQTSRRKG
jgi:murein hydrolase activator